MFIYNNDNDMTFFGNIVYLRLCSVIRARAANDTTRAQINNIPAKSHVIPLLSEDSKRLEGNQNLKEPETNCSFLNLSISERYLS